MATTKINEKTMLLDTDIVEDIYISAKGVAYDADGEVLMKNVNGIYSKNADNYAAIVSGEKIHANDVQFTVNGQTVTIEGYFSSNGKKPFYIGSYDKDGSGVKAFVTDLVTEAQFDNLNLYNEYNYAEKHSADGKITTTKFNGTSFNDNFDLSGFNSTQLVDAKGKDITSLTINAGAGDDVVLGSIVDDVITGGAGENTVYTSGETNYEFGDDTYKLTKGENLVIDDGDAVQTYEYTTDGTNATITASHQVADETAVNATTTLENPCYTYNSTTDTYTVAAVAPTTVYALKASDEEASIAVADKYTFNALNGTITKLAADVNANNYKAVTLGDEVAINAAGAVQTTNTTITKMAAEVADKYFNITAIAEANYGTAGYQGSVGDTVFTEAAATGTPIYAAGATEAYASNKLSESIEYDEEQNKYVYKEGAVKYYTTGTVAEQTDANLVSAENLHSYIRYALTGTTDDYEGKASEATALYEKTTVDEKAVFTFTDKANVVRYGLTETPVAADKASVMTNNGTKTLYLLDGNVYTVSTPEARYELAGTEAYTGKASAAAFLYTQNTVDSTLDAVADNMVYARYNNLDSEELGTLTIDKLAKQEGVAKSITIGGQDLDDIQWVVDQDFTKKNAYKGSWLNETVDATLAKKGVNISTAGGNDIIFGSSLNDTLTGGAGNNKIDYSAFVADNSEFGTNTVNLTAATKNAEAESLNLNLGNNIIVNDQIVVSKLGSGNDIDVDVLAVNEVIKDSALTDEGATYMYNSATGKYVNMLVAETLYTDNAHENKYTKSITENISNDGKWVATLYDENGDAKVTAGYGATNDEINTYARYTLDDILVTDEAGEHSSLGTVTLKNLGKNNDLADVAINAGDLFENYKIYVNGTKGGKVVGTKGDDVVYLGSAKSAQVTATEGVDVVLAEEPVGDAANTAVTYTDSTAVAQDFIDNTVYRVGAMDSTFYINNVETTDSVTFSNTDTTFVDATKAKYQLAFADDDFDLSASKTNNILVADEGLALGNTGIDVKTGKGNDVVLLKSVAGAGKENTIDYVGGVDAFQGSTGAETYTVTSMDKNTALSINDLGGTDTLDFAGSGATFQNMTIFFDVTSDGKTGDDSLMLINNDVLSNSKSLAALFNGTGKGAVVLENYFVEDTAFTKGAGYIETVKQDGSATGAALDARVDAIAENVSAWLANNGNYDSAMDVIDAGNAADIQSLMLCYSAGTVA